MRVSSDPLWTTGASGVNNEPDSSWLVAHARENISRSVGKISLEISGTPCDVYIKILCWRLVV
jgi:hypothetical protein